ncbi:MAG: hypothetical protein QOK43_101 [Acidimicrobiaceae bacterium]|nr:hypothetical protein [Acidimicrobiaceae bacterium]
MHKKVELTVGHGHGTSVHADLSGSSIDDQPAAAEFGRRGQACSGRRPPHPNGELSGKERLDHVLVSAELEAENAITLLAATGEDDDWHTTGDDFAQQVEAALVGKSQIEHDDLWLTLRENRPCLGRGRRLGDAAPIADKGTNDQSAHRLRVLDDEHTRCWA